jgi:hypothetical protein
MIAEVDTGAVSTREPGRPAVDGVDSKLVDQFGGAGPHGRVAADRGGRPHLFRAIRTMGRLLVVARRSA